MESLAITVPRAKKLTSKIMIVDDDDVFLSTLKAVLERMGYEVVTASSARAARNIFGLEAPDAVISDIKMPETTGIELMHEIKRMKPVPVVLMTGFAELKETKEAAELGADGFIPKPFKREDLEQVLNLAIRRDDAPPAVEAAKVNLDDEYCKMTLDEFVSGKEIKYDIFIRLSETRYVKIAHSGEDLSSERIQAYKSKEIHYLYLRKEDFRAYLGFNMTLAPLVKASQQINKEKKIRFLKHTGEMIAQQIHLNDIDEQIYGYAKSIVESTISVVSDDADSFSLLESLNSHTDFLYAHSLGVSVYTTMIAKALGWKSPALVQRLTLAGLFHDIGKKEIPREILDKARKDMTPEDVKVYETHPQRGAEILGVMSYIPAEVLAVATQHHENCNGRGYPLGMMKERIHPLARLVAVANEFTNLALRNPNSPGLGAKEAIHRMTVLFADRLDPDYMLALMKVFKFPPPPEYLALASRRKPKG